MRVHGPRATHFAGATAGPIPALPEVPMLAADRSLSNSSAASRSSAWGSSPWALLGGGGGCCTPAPSPHEAARLPDLHQPPGEPDRRCRRTGPIVYVANTTSNSVTRSSAPRRLQRVAPRCRRHRAGEPRGATRRPRALGLEPRLRQRERDRHRTPASASYGMVVETIQVLDAKWRHAVRRAGGHRLREQQQGLRRALLAQPDRGHRRGHATQVTGFIADPRAGASRDRGAQRQALRGRVRVGQPAAELSACATPGRDPTRRTTARSACRSSSPSRRSRTCRSRSRTSSRGRTAPGPRRLRLRHRDDEALLELGEQRRHAALRPRGGGERHASTSAQTDARNRVNGLHG